MNVNPAPTPEDREGFAAFLLRLRSRGISDIGVLRALEMVPRDAFVPHRYLDLALRDVALPIGCGQTMPEPFLVARAMEALSLSPGHRVLEIGTGSGYSAAVIARLAAEVVSLERFQTLALEASTRLADLGIQNARVLWADGLALPEGLGLFDRVVVHGVVGDPRWTGDEWSRGLVFRAAHIVWLRARRGTTACSSAQGHE